MDRLKTAIEKAMEGARLDTEDALALYTKADLLALGRLAARQRWRLRPEPVATFVVDRNINYTNICVSGCLFCAFHAAPGSPDGYVLSEAELEKKLSETVSLGGTQVLLQGGMNPDLDLAYYKGLLRFIKSVSGLHIHGFSPPEIAFFSKQWGLSVEAVLRELVAAGLDSIPGGGAEILADEIRNKISPGKCDAATWLDVMETAHTIGLRSSATMMFGHVETPRHLIDHLMAIRNLQDRTSGFTAFIPWSFQPQNTRLKGTPASAVDYLKVVALSRLVLDNVPNIQASWVTQGDKISQVALGFGANDMGSTMIEENVVAAAGVRFRLPREAIIRLIEGAGLRAAQRDCFYRILQYH